MLFRSALPSNPDEVFATFKTPRVALASVARIPQSSLADSPFKEPQRKEGNRLGTPIRKSVKRGSNLISPLQAPARPMNLRGESSNAAAPARKVVPFLALQVPVPIPDEALAESSSIPPKRPPLPKFELGGDKKGKLAAMTTLELPRIYLLEEKEVAGEALELQRGLLVSPEKGDRRRGRFVRYVKMRR